MASPAFTLPAPRSATKACKFCRIRKIRCDTEKPRCGSCRAHNAACDYTVEPSKKRPSNAIINDLQKENEALADILLRLKGSNLPGVNGVLDSVSITDAGRVRFSGPGSNAATASDIIPEEHDSHPTDVPRTSAEDHGDVVEDSSDEELDRGLPPTMAATSAQVSSRSSGAPTAPYDFERTGTLKSMYVDIVEHLRFKLTANAALQLREEQSLRQTLRLDYIRGVPGELAMHLLDLHWNRQHHTFHLTYRPAFMRELVSGGEYCTDFLLCTVFACSSKYSERAQLVDARFFERCDELLTQQSLLTFPSIPTIVGLLLLGPNLNSQGFTSKGWLYTGYALRMIQDLGLHSDSPATTTNGEEVEIRRRVFWGAFICEKLQSLYLGRPFTLRLRDSNIPCDFMDTFEELELWQPYIDPTVSGSQSPGSHVSIHIHSITTFQNFCELAKIMAKILDRFYSFSGRDTPPLSHLKSTDESLLAWYRKLPPHLAFEPSSKQRSDSQPVPAPNVITLLTTYNALVILLHRPFILDGNSKRSNVSTQSWRRCSTAAQNITNLVLAYQSTYPLHRANYLLGYALYVACTIHVRNYATAESCHDRTNIYSSTLISCMKCLDELAVPNGGVSNLVNIIRRLMKDSGLPTLPEIQQDFSTTSSASLMSLQNINFDPSLSIEGMDPVGSFIGFETYSQDLLFGFMDDFLPMQGHPLDGNHGWK